MADMIRVRVSAVLESLLISIINNGTLFCADIQPSLLLSRTDF